MPFCQPRQLQFIMLYNGLKISEHEAYWLMNYLLLLIGCVKIFYDIINHSLACTSCKKANKQEQRKLVTSQLIGIILKKKKLEETRVITYAPAHILVGI